MPRMSKKRKEEWAFFLNERNRITYNPNKMLLIIVGVLEFTEIVNSFIQSEELERVEGETTVLF